MHPDQTEARRKMVDRQIRTCDVTNPALLAALFEIAREAFVPEELRALAYLDEEASTGAGPQPAGAGGYPILTADGREAVLTDLPNATNIGSGTVFANYGGEPLPAACLDASPGSAKGTAIVYTSFVCINCRVINRYGQPEGQPSPFDILRNRELTILGLGSFVENKLTGRVPAFSYANDLSARSHRLGWVLA
ncbi:MAG: hypothetical protein HC814_07720, partial [Rhodobacteraceae bacterium]|nr:hypothetical protein [Paracoccaceae bacterium]